MEPYLIAIIVIACVAFAALCIFFVWFSNSALTLSRYGVKDERIREEGVKIVHLSDLHAKTFGKANARLIKKVAAEKPDFIAVTGDIIHKYRDRDKTVALDTVSRLAAVAPVYYVSGNHEMRSREYRDFKEKLKAAGACVLDDEAVTVCNLTLCGVNCAHIKRGKFYNLADGSDKFKILMAHFPHYLDKYAMAGYDMALCGHAHGGQWRIPFTDIGFYSPGQGLFPKLTSKMRSCGHMQGVISRGLGNSQCPLRLFNRPEIVVVELKNK